jgi:methionine-rich copper-binding protein CopC
MRKFTGLLLVLATFCLTNPALAHDELISTSPSPNATVSAGSIQVKLTFAEKPMDLPFGQGNLIAVALAENGEQLGPACARVDGTSLITSLNLDSSGEYKLLWRVASEDGHVNSGEYNFTVENQFYYNTDHPGNQCFDENGVELTGQQPLSKKIEQNDGMWTGLIVAVVIAILGALVGTLGIRRSLKN